MNKPLANQLPISVIKNAILDICVVLEEQEPMCLSLTHFSEDDLWRELVSCILGSRVRFSTACAAVERLDDMRLLRHSRCTSNFDQYETDILTILSGKYPFYKLRRIRFDEQQSHSTARGTQSRISWIILSISVRCGNT